MEKQKLSTKKTIISTVVFFISFFAVYYITKKFTGTSDADVDKQLVKITNKINEKCPMVIDQYTTLKNSEALPNKTLQYNYMLIYDKAEVNLDTVKKYLFPNILANLKSSPDMKSLRDMKVTFNYNYSDKNGIFVVKDVITPDMYLSE